MKKNKDIRKIIIESGIKFWEVGNRYGISDGSFSKLLRYELPKEKKNKIIEIVKEMKEEKRNEK